MLPAPDRDTACPATRRSGFCSPAARSCPRACAAARLPHARARFRPPLAHPPPRWPGRRPRSCLRCHCPNSRAHHCMIASATTTMPETRHGWDNGIYKQATFYLARISQSCSYMTPGRMCELNPRCHWHAEEQHPNLNGTFCNTRGKRVTAKLI